MSETKHSPTPWKYWEGHTNSSGQNLGGIISAESLYVAEVCPDAGLDESDPHRANGEHIVKCVNLHDELVAALEDAVAVLRDQQLSEREEEILATCAIALTKAKEAQ